MYAQPEANIANGSPYGIFVFCNTELVSESFGTEKKAFRIERKKAGTNNWSFLHDISAPADKYEFAEKLQYWGARFPDWNYSRQISAEKIYTDALKHKNLDSLDAWSQVLPVRLALGAVYLDSTIQDTLLYQYRISTITPDDVAIPIVVSNAEKKRSHADLGEITFEKRISSGSDISIFWQHKNASRNFYRVFRKQNKTVNFLQIFPVIYKEKLGDNLKLLIRDTLVNKNSLYYYHIQAVDYYGRTGTFSDVATAAAYNFQDVRGPYNINTGPASIAGGITLTWDLEEPDMIKSLQIFKSSNYDSGYQFITELDPAVRTFSDYEAEPMKKYFYYFVTKGHLGEISQPGPRVFGIAKNKIPPFAPVITAYESIKNGARLTLMCHDEDIRGVRVYRRPVVENQKQFLLITGLIPFGSNPVVFVDTSRNYTGKICYEYVVQAENTSYTLSSFSDTVAVRPEVDYFPPPVSNFRAEYANKAIHLSWKNMAEEDETVAGYRLFKRTMSGTSKQVPFKLIKEILYSPVSNFFSDSLVDEGQNYQYKIITLNNLLLESKTAVSLNVAVPAQKPVAPGDMKLTNTADGILLEWEIPYQRQIASYKVYRYQRGQKHQIIATLKPDEVTFVDKTAKKGGLYFYYLTTTTQNGQESKAGRELSVWR